MSSRRVRSMIALPMVCAAVLLAPPTSALAGDVAAEAPPPPPRGELVVSPSVQRDLPPIKPRKAIEIADRTPQVRSERARHPNLRPDNIVLFNGSKNWGISYLAGKDKLADITVDGRTGKVIEAWQGVQAAWVMARGHPGYFGKRFDSWYIWLPLCLLFVAPFFDPRRPFRMLHLDLLVLVAGFGASHYFYIHGHIGTSVPLVYPVLVYLLARMLYAGFRPRDTGQKLIPYAPAAYFVVAIIALIGFRATLDVTGFRIGDVGYASAVGAYRIEHGKPLYVDSGDPDQHFDTYGPVTYLAYLPFVKVFQPTEEQVNNPQGYELPAALSAALAFDLLTIVGLFLLGRRLRGGREGRMLGLALAYAWVAFPYTLFPLMTSTNDALISMLLVGALLAITSPSGRGAFVALASAAKFAPLALAPLFATGRGDEPRSRAWTLFTIAFVVVAAALVLPFIPVKGGFSTFWSQTMGFQLTRQSPFSIWGQNPGLDGLLTVVKLGVAALAVLVAFVPRQRTTVQVAALGAAVVIATQLIAIHWFYLYIDWFMPFLLVALLSEYRTGRAREHRPEPATVEIAPTPLARERELAGVG